MNEKKVKLSPKKIVIWTFLFIGAVIMMTPIIFMFSASLKYNDQIYDLALFSSDFTLDNYIYIIENTDRSYR